AVEMITAAADSEANIIFGASIDDSLEDEVRITVIATGFEKEPFPPRTSSLDPAATLPSQAPYVSQSYQPSYQAYAAANSGNPGGSYGFNRYESYQPVSGNMGNAPVQEPAAAAPSASGPDVPSFLNEPRENPLANLGNYGQTASPTPYGQPQQETAQNPQAAAPERNTYEDRVPSFLRKKR
ncbi:MAG: hypothetical protein IJ088_02735, partial [Clostridia bacterium]|nr:hypothetical protein [Clostridia bacterium]